MDTLTFAKVLIGVMVIYFVAMTYLEWQRVKHG